MRSSFKCILAEIPVQFLEFGDNDFWNLWRWKMDPYCSNGDSNVQLIIAGTCPVKDNCSERRLLDSNTAGFFKWNILQLEDNSYLWQYVESQGEIIKLEIAVSSDLKRITVLQDNTHTSGLLAFEALGRIWPVCALKNSVLTIHGVLMEYKGQGIVISAPSGTGKTTHARLWRDYKNALIINGDRASLRKEGDTWYGYGLPWSGTSGEQINRKVPVKAVVVLERADINSTQLLDGIEAFEAVLAHLQAPVWHTELSVKAIDLMMALISDVPVIRLGCRPDTEAVEVLEAALNEL